MHKVYHPSSLSETVILSEEESRHLSKVLRKKNGDQVILLDGKGTKADAIITHSHPKKTQLLVQHLSSVEKRSDTTITIGIAPTKNTSRLEWFIEKATEIGVDRIIPLACKHNERKVLKTDRLNKVAVSAMKQSGQLFLPKIDELTPIKEVIQNQPNGLIAYCPDRTAQPTLLNEVKNRSDILLLIGPEGDFSEEEINFAKQYHYQSIGLGTSILRTETAGIFACSIINGWKNELG